MLKLFKEKRKGCWKHSRIMSHRLNISPVRSSCCVRYKLLTLISIQCFSTFSSFFQVLNDETKKDAEAEINSLLEANEALSQDLTRQRAEWTIKVSNLERDVEHERSRYDALESLAAEERDETEKRWQQLWEAHSERIKDEVNTLKLNYTNPLKQSQEREEKLKVAIELNKTFTLLVSTNIVL